MSRDERGVAIVEAALVFVVLTFLVTVLIDLGILLCNSYHLSTIAREGARAAVQLPGLTANDARVSNYMTALCASRTYYLGSVVVTNTALASIAGVDDSSGVSCDQYTTVTISAQYQPLFVRFLGAAGVTIGRRASMRYQRQRQCT